MVYPLKTGRRRTTLGVTFTLIETLETITGLQTPY